MAGFQIPFPIDPTNPIRIDARYGSQSNNWAYWDTVSAAIAGVVSALRVKGLPVGILVAGKVVEYWWEAGILDSDLVIKITSSVTGGIEITNSTLQGYLKDSNNWGASYGWNWLNNFTIAGNENDYYIGTETSSGSVYLYTLKKIAGVLTPIRIALQLS